MTAVNVPLSREPVEGTPRASMTAARRARILARQGPICARSNCAEPWSEIDHIVPLALGGAEADHNAEGLCAAHHAEKTARDIRMIAKAKRQQRADLGLKPRLGPKIRSRGFPKDPLR